MNVRSRAQGCNSDFVETIRLTALGLKPSVLSDHEGCVLPMHVPVMLPHLQLPSFSKSVMLLRTPTDGQSG